MKSLYEVVFILTGIFSLYAWYILIAAFSQKTIKNMKQIIIVLVGFYAVSNLIHFAIDLPILNLLTTLTLLAILAKLLNYEKNKMLLSVAFSLLIIIGVDIIVFVSSGGLPESIVGDTEYYSILGRFMTIIITYAIGVGIYRFKHVSKEIEIPITYWITLVVFPVFSIFLLIIIMMYSVYSSMVVIISSVMIMIMNVIIFSLYNNLMELYGKRIEDLAINQLNDSYKKQLNLMKTSVVTTRSLHHDFNRHLSSINTLIESNRYDEAIEYTNQAKKQLTDEEMISRTGNTIIDSIINFEFATSSILAHQVELNGLNIPESIPVTDFDLTIILSNLTRNAMQATEQVEDGHVIIGMDYNKGVFYLNIKNSYTGELNMVKGELTTIYTEDEKRGYGLNNVKKSVANYDGELKLGSTEHQFEADLMLYTNFNNK